MTVTTGTEKPAIVRRAHATDPACPTHYHLSADAYVHGCQCPEAFAAYEDRRTRSKTVPAAVDDQGRCIAEQHGDTWAAYRSSGCRCPGALQAHQRRLAAQARYQCKQRKDGGPATRRRTAITAVRRWTGEQTRVSRISVSLAMAGFVDGATRHELMLAARQLSRTGNQWGTALITQAEIAERLRVSREQVTNLIQLPAKLAADRTRRRLALANYRAVTKHARGTR